MSELLIELINPAKREALQQFLALFTSLPDDTLPSSALEHIIKHTGYFTYLQQSYEKAEALERQDNVKELLQAARSRQEQGTRSVHGFLEEIALLQEDKTTRLEDQDYVSLMTLHAAKGLEFDTVLITGLEEGILPSGHALLNSESIEEERRLFYVGITRAQSFLLITHARFRSTYGQRSDQRASRFLKELVDITHITHQEASLWGNMSFMTYFRQWFRK